MMIFEWLKELLFPRKCVLCQGILPKNQTDLCHDCRSTTLEWYPNGKAFPHLDGHTAVWFYEDQVRDSLLRYKFRGKRHYAKVYGRLLAMQVRRTLPAVDMVTWVPVSARRRRQRGYDQSELLALAVAAELCVPAECTLKKLRDNPAQSGITDPALRRENVKNVYRTAFRSDLAGKRILLIDDILTTGATACECAKTLRTSGVESVFLGVMATGRTRKQK